MLVDHRIATTENIRQAPAAGKLMEYTLAGNGIFIRALREGLAAQIPMMLTSRPIQGLPNLRTAIALPERVPGRFLKVILDMSKIALPNEMLFYLLRVRGAWELYAPRQIADQQSVCPADPLDPAAAEAVIEVHSHNHMPAFFSKDDDKDEKGFRIFVVIGRVDQPFPEINARVGIYGNMAAVPAAMVFDGLGRMIDVNAR
jgi:PRTRC genetic system protein A